MTEPISRHDVVVVGARAAGAATAMLLARAGLDVLVVDRSRYGADTLSTHALMRGGVVQLHRWGCSTPSSPPAPPRCARTTFTYADDEVTVTIKPSHGVDALYAPRRTVLDPILVDAAALPAPPFATARASPASPATAPAGSTASSAATATAGRCGTPPAGSSAPTACARPSPTRSTRRSSGRAPAPPPSSTATGPGSTTDGYEWIFRPRRLRRAHPDQRRPARACSPAPRPARIGRGGLGRAPRRRPRAPRRSSRDRLAAGHAPAGVRDVRRACPATCACRGDRAGRSSATPATGRTRSAPTGSPTRSATPSCSPGRSSP